MARSQAEFAEKMVAEERARREKAMALVLESVADVVALLMHDGKTLRYSIAEVRKEK